MQYDLLCKKVEKAREDAFWARDRAMQKQKSAIKAEEYAKNKSEEYATLRLTQHILYGLKDD